MKLSLGTAIVLVLAACSASSEVTSVGRASNSLPGAPPRFTHFESGQVRPLALAPGGGTLYAVNTPANRLEIFDVTSQGLEHEASIPVGLEPVAIAVHGHDEVWVVNHLSDSVSVVRVTGPRPRVVRTLLVGDEPRDIVFAGPQGRRAFITTAHRGQNVPYDAQLQTPGIGRADVWVFDSQNLGSSLTGTPLTIVTLFTDTPRALAVSADGSRVYAAGFHTGNRTTMIHDILVPDGGQEAGGIPAPNTDYLGVPQQASGLIVKFNGSHWLDSLGRLWDASVNFTLPDKDVFVIDALASPPAQIGGAAGSYSGVGTILYNMAVNPVNGAVYVANTEARNDLRFEGPAQFWGESLRGHQHESRITVVTAGQVRPRHLNKHIDYTSCCAPVPNPVNAKSLALPQAMAVTSDGSTLYVAAFGSSKIGVFATAQLEDDSFVPSAADQIPVTGGGPSGLVLDESRGRLYVMTRFDNSVSIVDAATRHEAQHLRLFDPEPASVQDGRRFLYDAASSSSNGEAACGSCHVFGDFDSLAWNLGNPDATTRPNPNPITQMPAPFPPEDTAFQALKGPFTTQSLRGMANHGPMHWRGDRTGAYDAPSVQPDSGSFDEDAAFKQFNPAFESLLGRSQQLAASEMQAFTDFALQIVYPPNPNRNLDNTLTSAQQAGRDHYFAPGAFFQFSCNDCHRLDPTANRELGVPFPGLFGTTSMSMRLAGTTTPPLKIPHLRNIYQKVGMFGLPELVFLGFVLFPGEPFAGDQVRGFGVTHDGSFGSPFEFIGTAGFSTTFSPNGFAPGPAGDSQRRDLVDFLLAFDSNLAPIVGQQTTLTADNGAQVGSRIDLLTTRAAAGECELVVKASGGATELGFLYDAAAGFRSNVQALPPISPSLLRLLAATPVGELTYTCVPVGSGRRLALDADLDGVLDGDERIDGSDPFDPLSTP